METKEIKIIPPEGFEIDRENSTLECIKFKPCEKRWRDRNDNLISGYYLCGNGVAYLDGGFYNYNHDVFVKKKQARSASAMAQISQIMANDPRFGGIVTDEEFEDENIWTYSINRNLNKIEKYQGTFGVDHFLSFHTPEQRDLFLEENEDLIRDYLMIK